MNNVEQRVEEILKQLTLREKVALLSGADAWNTVAIERLGIPSLTMTDGPHGVRANRREAGRLSGATTAFPTGSAMAATWNPELIERVAGALAEETLALGCDILLGPCVNIVRHPLAGRNFEAYSEDPFLAGKIGVAWVKGLQGQGVGASLKHFACNNQEAERFRGSSVVDERTLREIYLAQFEMIVKEAKPWTVMCSYNRINGVYASQHNHLLNEILRDEWGFEGVVVSDWNANHTTIDSVQNGLDLEMPGPARYYGNLLYEAASIWQIEESTIDQAVRRILQMSARAGRLDAPCPAGSVNTAVHQDIAREAAEEAITLLKNENATLPLKLDAIKSIAVIGPNATEMQVSGGGSSKVEPAYRLSPLDALKTKLGDCMKIEFEQGCDNFTTPPLIKSEYLLTADGSAHGLNAEFFNNTELTGAPAIVAIEPLLSYWWWNDPAEKRISYDRFSARWTGKLIVPESGMYTLQIGSSAHARAYIDGKLALDRDAGALATGDAALPSSVQVELVGGHAHDFKIEFVKKTGENFAGLHVGLARAYRPGEDVRMARAVELARRSDVTLVFIGLPEHYETEGHDRPDMEITGAQNELVKQVAAANRNTVVVVNVGAPVTMPWIDQVPAAVLMYYPGVQGGSAIANILCGDVNPSGKLPVTFPKRLQDTSAFVNYPGTREVLYGEGVFVGYRWYDARDIEPLFPFGHGLSYTTFEYSDLRVPGTIRLGEPIQVSVAVKNSGTVAGKETVQLYVADKEATFARPGKELKGFQKVALEPGESKTLSFTLDERALSFYNPYEKRWVAEPGEFGILIGSSASDIRAFAPMIAE